MGDEDFARRVSGVGALADPVRRALYRVVVRAEDPVSRDQVAQRAGVARHVARFHLDRLVDEGLLATEYRRLSGRSGPGAGRPAKLYRRAADEVSVSLPERRYRLAGRLMATAIEAASDADVPVARALAEAAAAHGHQVGRAATAGRTPAPGTDAVLAALCGALEREGYEPRAVGREVVLANCPFHALVEEHAALVCRMNLALLEALGAELGGSGGVAARLDPAPGRCCVVLAVGAED